jgi:hypothetical protein
MQSLLNFPMSSHTAYTAQATVNTYTERLRQIFAVWRNAGSPDAQQDDRLATKLKGELVLKFH